MGHLKSYLKKAKCIQEIISRHYEPGRQDRNLRAVHRRYIEPLFGVCYKSCLRAWHTDTSILNSDQKEKKDEKDCDFHFTEGNIYMFSTCPFGSSSCGVYGIYDRMDNGRIRLEVLWYGGNILLYNDYLPIHFRYVRCAKPDEIRDFCFAYGYRQREKEQHHL